MEEIFFRRRYVADPLPVRHPGIESHLIADIVAEPHARLLRHPPREHSLCDSSAMVGKVDTKDAEVDNDHSPVVDRVHFGWTCSQEEWHENWEVDIRYTTFVPVSVLALYY